MSKTLSLVSAVILMVAILLSLRFPAGRLSRKLPLNHNMTFIELSHGRVLYNIERPPAGQENGNVVVLVHGLSIPSILHGPLATRLASEGHTVVRYDLYGRGYSDAPDVAHNDELHVGQLAELLFALGPQLPGGRTPDNVDLVGLSLGGAIVTLFARLYPERVERLTVIAPAGLPVNKPLVARFLELPVIGEIVVRFFGPFFMERGARTQWHAPDEAPEFVVYGNAVRDTITEHPGFLRSMSRTVTHFPLSEMTPVFEEVGKHSRPVLAIWGDEDLLTPYSNAEQLLQLMPRATLVTVEQGNHLAIAEQPDVVLTAVSKFLARGEGEGEQES